MESDDEGAWFDDTTESAEKDGDVEGDVPPEAEGLTFGEDARGSWRGGGAQDGDGAMPPNCCKRKAMEGVLSVTWVALPGPTTDSHPALLRTRTPTVAFPALSARDMGSTTPEAAGPPLNEVREDVTEPSADNVTNWKDKVAFPLPASAQPRVAKSNLGTTPRKTTQRGARNHTGE